ncbi:MAG TPA: hypothetical protein ENK49_06260 [Gammaproteobacteria bacterium]|nr:hypothetical protein [Gammaproteobacteria bacterium]
MKSITGKSVAVFIAALLISAPLQAEDLVFSVGESSVDRPQHWQTFTAGMSDQQYRRAYRSNQHRISRFIKSYSENALLSAGVPRVGIKAIGVAAGLAANRDATLYLNRSHILALQFKDMVNDNRALFFGVKMDW